MKKLCLAAALAFSFAAAPALADDAVKEVWTAKCKSCHGATGKADTKQGKKHKVDDLTDAKWQERHSDEKIKKAIAEGVPDTKMKSYKDKLSDAEMDGLVKLIRSFKQ